MLKQVLCMLEMILLVEFKDEFLMISQNFLNPDAYLQIILAFLAAWANPLKLSAKVRDFSTLSSASKGLSITIHVLSLFITFLWKMRLKKTWTFLKHSRNAPETPLQPPWNILVTHLRHLLKSLIHHWADHETSFKHKYDKQETF